MRSCAPYTPAYTHNMWSEQVKTYTHIYVTYVSFLELIIAYPNDGQWAPFRKVCPPWLRPQVTPLRTVVKEAGVQANPQVLI